MQVFVTNFWSCLFMFYELILDGIPNNNIKNKSANNKNFYLLLSPRLGLTMI